MKWSAQLVSILFHPLFSVFYGLSAMLLIKPHWFSVIYWQDAHLIMLYVFIYTIFIPVIGIFLLLKTGFIKSLEMTQKFERIAPLILCMIFYFWLFINLKNQNNIPKVFQTFLLASVISLALSFVLNNWIKISLHMVGAGALVMLLFFIRFSFSEDGLFYLRFHANQVSGFHLNSLIVSTLAISGIIGTARMIREAHYLEEIALGFFIGGFSTILAFSYSY